MDLNFSPEELVFREEVRAFIAAHLPDDIRGRVRCGDDSHGADDVRRWQKILHAHGWGATMWPVEHGGTGWDKTRQFLFESECVQADAPIQLPFGLKMVAPVIMRYGLDAQKGRFLPRILDGSDWWCQGYSEPGSGSDLASLKTRAERDGDHFVINGQKAWNTLGQHADWIFCLVRTDPAAKPQRGISFILIDMKTPGIRLQQTRLLDGHHEVNEVFFDDVRVPVENLVGEENAGWTYAKFLLGHERTNIAGIGASHRELKRLKGMAGEATRDGGPMLDDVVFATRIAQVELELKALEVTNLRVIFGESRQQTPGPEASMLKVRGTEILQRISELQVEAMGVRALQFDGRGEDVPRSVHQYMNLRKLSIYGGSNEIQRNIIAQMILKL